MEELEALKREGESLMVLLQSIVGMKPNLVISGEITLLHLKNSKDLNQIWVID